MCILVLVLFEYAALFGLEYAREQRHSIYEKLQTRRDIRDPFTLSCFIPTHYFQITASRKNQEPVQRI